MSKYKNEGYSLNFRHYNAGNLAKGNIDRGAEVGGGTVAAQAELAFVPTAFAASDKGVRRSGRKGRNQFQSVIADGRNKAGKAFAGTSAGFCEYNDYFPYIF